MNAMADVGIKGWCPGVLRPMPSGDGLLVRIRPRRGAIAIDEAHLLADLAERLGNGHIDLTRRANIQLRGLQEGSLDELKTGLDRVGLVDGDARVEAARNIMVAPLAGLDCANTIDVRPIVSELEQAFATDPLFAALPGKFGLVIDGGGPLSIAGERADISLFAHGEKMAIGIDTPGGTQWLGAISSASAGDVVCAAIHAFLDRSPKRRMRDLGPGELAKVRGCLLPLLAPVAAIVPSGRRMLGLVDGAVGVAAPFGRVEATQLRRLADLADTAGARDLRLSPWRTLYIGVGGQKAGRALLDGARALDLIVADDDPLLRIEACPGAPGCRSSSVDARGDARRLATMASARGFEGSIHVSGCAKGCARSAPSNVVLIGKSGRYRVARNATTSGKVERTIDAGRLELAFAGPADA